MSRFRVNPYFSYKFKKPVEITTINNVKVIVEVVEVQYDGNSYFFNDTGNSIYDEDPRRKVYCVFKRLFKCEFVQVLQHLSKKQVNYLENLIESDIIKFANESS